MDSVNDRPPAPDWLQACYQEHVDRLRAFSLGLVRDHALSEEIVQTTFEIALSKGHEVRAGNEKAWLFQVAYHEAMRLRRRQLVHQKSLKQLACPQEVLPPEQQAALSESAERVRTALDSLPAEQKAIVIERMYHDRTFQEISESRSIPLGTVLTRMRLALKKLAQALQSDQ